MEIVKVSTFTYPRRYLSRSFLIKHNQIIEFSFHARYSLFITNSVEIKRIMMSLGLLTGLGQLADNRDLRLLIQSPAMQFMLYFLWYNFDSSYDGSYNRCFAYIGSLAMSVRLISVGLLMVSITDVLPTLSVRLCLFT